MALPEDVAMGTGVATAVVGFGLAASLVILSVGIATAHYSKSNPWDKVVQPNGVVCLAVQLEEGPDLLCPVSYEPPD